MTDKVTDKIAALPQDSCYFSLEFFPPKTQIGFANLHARLERMSHALRPLFVTVTWGAGGSTASKSIDLAKVCQRQLGLTTVLHLTCTNMSRKLVDEALASAKEIGIRNILALRGDPPRSSEYNLDGEDDSNKDFNYAVDLVRYIRQTHGDYFAVGVAAYPEGHANESHPDHQDPAHDLPYLIEKVKAGADFIMTQLTYDVDAYLRFEKFLRDHESGVFKTLPIIPGLMPIQSYTNLTRVTKLSHVRVPEDIRGQLDAVKADDDAVKRIGVDLLSNIVQKIKELPSPGARGLHFYTLNLEKSVTKILEKCDLIPYIEPTQPIKNVISEPPLNGVQSQHNQVILDHKDKGKESEEHEVTPKGVSMNSMVAPAQHDTVLQISEGMGSLGREATWDDFPNGRWGDPRSPAFGEIDGYGPSLHVSAPVARRLWGFPVDRADVSALFRRHILGELSAVPWSEGGIEDESNALNPETDTIRKELLNLIDGRGWWTLASQPAVNGVRSDDKTFGWGPPGEGFVFQKAFVEFFCSKQSFEEVLTPLFKKYDEDELTWFAVNAAGRFTSSAKLCSPSPSASPTSQRRGSQESSNAVTWGVFRGKEIITPTIIEEVSFKAWGEEAFRIWDEWRQIFPRGSPTEQFLDKMKNDVYLVCVIGQRFGAGTEDEQSEEAERKALWKILGGEAESNGV